MYLIWKIIKISKISKFWNCSSILYSAPFAILIILILHFNINLIFYYSHSRKFSRSTFARSLIFKFEISVILKFYSSKYWPSPVFPTHHCVKNHFPESSFSRMTFSNRRLAERYFPESSFSRTSFSRKCIERNQHHY